MAITEFWNRYDGDIINLILISGLSHVSVGTEWNSLTTLY